MANLIDRILRNGSVRDYVQLGIGPLHTGVFNLADVAIVAGVLTFALHVATGKDAAGAQH